MELIKIDERVFDGEDNVETATRYTLGKYIVERELIEYASGIKIETISVDISYKEQHDNYMPEIYYERRFGENKGHFEIQTTSYGSLIPEDIKKVIDGYKEALEVVRVLTKEFC